MPIAIPVLVVLFAIFLVLVPLVTDPQLAYVYGIALMVLSPAVYYPMVHRKFRIPGMDAFTAFMQQGLEVSPTDWKDDVIRSEHED